MVSLIKMFQSSFIIRSFSKIETGKVVSGSITGVDFYPILIRLAGGIPYDVLDSENIFDWMKKIY